uniref:RRM domain-containing protein n=1 Tax=Acanthochromis polyacanthus TaxID=80966 RepID=A0A3Q1FW95_9TELE
MNLFSDSLCAEGPGFRLSVRRSIEKRQLCIGDLPDATRQEDLLQVLRVFAEGVEKVSLKTGPGIDGVSAIVTFSSHHSASMAKKVVVEAFKKHFALTVSLKWQSTEKPNPSEPQPLQKPPKSLPLPLKPPRHASRPPVLPPRLAVPPSISPGFCRAVGGPPVPQQLQASCCYQGHAVFAGSPVMLSKLCEVTEEEAGWAAAQQVLQRVYKTQSAGCVFHRYAVCLTVQPAALSNKSAVLLQGCSAVGSFQTGKILNICSRNHSNI